ncbi:MAG TPA: AarF/UbiB family protein [Rugosimonospora sp.]|nr:AarF/UbiB family protein [Rugosimonospora sp.]
MSDNQNTGKVPAWRMLARLAVIVAIGAAGTVMTLLAMLGGLLTGGRTRARRLRYRGLVATLQALGPTFVKFGQTSSTRRDAMSEEMAAAMGRLHDRVRPMSRRQRDRALRQADITALVEVGAEPVASGSIACVYKGVLTDGRVVAVKLKRPGIERRMRTDLALAHAMMRGMQRMPNMRGMPMADLVDYVGRAILGQLDFAREAENIAHLRTCLREVGQIRVPAVYPELSAPNCLLFEYLPQLDVGTPATLPPDVRKALADRVLQAANTMMFTDGFVHCDLHPGNVYLTPDQRVVILDAGYCVHLPERVKDLIGEFFECLAFREGWRCGEIILDSAVDPSRADREAFIAGMVDIVDRHAGPDREFDMKAFGDEVFKLQQRHGIYAASDFAFPLMSLNVLDGTVRGFSEQVDFQQVGVAGQQRRHRAA